MSIVSNSFIEIRCDGPGCSKTVTFPQTAEGEQQALQANPWLNMIRSIQTYDNRKFVYCSDECEVRGIGTSQHNKQESKILTGDARTMEMAAQEAARAREATNALRKGR
jgi:hypothetical protein